MNYLVPIRYEEKNLLRISHRYNLSFYIENDILCSNSLKKGTRFATDEEIEMWKNITSSINLKELPATKEEIQYSIEFVDSPIIISLIDFKTFQSLNNFINLCEEDKYCDIKYLGYFKSFYNPIYVSKKIMPGFFYYGSHISKLYLNEKLNNNIKNDIILNLKPFTISEAEIPRL